MTARRLHAIGLLTAGLCCTWPSAPAWCAVTASADRTQLAPGDTVELTLQSDRSGTGQPDLQPLEKDFEILRRGTSNSLQIVNGSVSSQRQVKLTLAPRRNGRVEVPRLAWDGEQSAVIELSVAAGNGRGGSGAAAGSVADVFFTTTLDSLQPHVQSAVSLQLRLYSDKKLYQASVDFPGTPDVLVRRIGQDVTTEDIRNGRTYQVITRHYVLVPQRSGEIQFDGPVLNAQVADGTRSLDPFMERVFGQLQIEGGASGTRALRLRGDPVRLIAKPRPPGMGTGDWLPAQHLTIDETRQPPGGAVSVGVPVTRRLRLSAVGLGASQLPDLGTLMTLPAGLSAHQDEPKLEDEVKDGHVVGHREQDIVLLADRAGRFELPELRVTWWDVVTNQRRESVLPAVTLNVEPGTNTPAPPGGTGAASASIAERATTAAAAPSEAAAAAPSPAPEGHWRWISLALGLLWLGTLGLWAGTHPRFRLRVGAHPVTGPTAAPDPSSAAAQRAFQRACRDHDPRRARDTLLAWAKTTWPESAPAGVHALARRLARSDLTPLLRDLDRSCIDGTPWQGEALARALPSLDVGVRADPANTGSLPGLYAPPEA